MYFRLGDSYKLNPHENLFYIYVTSNWNNACDNWANLR